MIWENHSSLFNGLRRQFKTLVRKPLTKLRNYPGSTRGDIEILLNNRDHVITSTYHPAKREIISIRPIDR